MSAWRDALRAFALVLAPFAPHHAEEMWGALGEPYSVHEQAWPAWDEALIRAEEITLVVRKPARANTLVSPVCESASRC